MPAFSISKPNISKRRDVVCQLGHGWPYWDKSNAIAQRTYANSPHRFVDKWDTPIMISHGELDYRILASQG
jgi:dipeptidyl aminopeptidase/acylaminoacyl peptidase